MDPKIHKVITCPEDLGLTLECLECGKLCPTFEFLKRHAARCGGENFSWVKYVMKHAQNPKCGCGCGGNVNYHKDHWKKYIHKHAIKDPVVLKKSQEGGAEWCKDPDNRQHMRDVMFEKWKDPNFVAQQQNTRSDPNAPYNTTRNDRVRELARTPERRAEAARIKKEQWIRDRDMMMTIIQSDSNRRKISERTILGLAPPEIRKKISDGIKQAIREGRFNPTSNYHNLNKSEWEHPFTGRHEFFISGWERIFAEACVAQGIIALHKHEIRIDYFNPADGKDHVYTPDFYLPEEDILIEIKGQIYEDNIPKLETSLRGFETFVFYREDLDSFVDIPKLIEEHRAKYTNESKIELMKQKYEQQLLLSSKKGIVPIPYWISN